MRFILFFLPLISISVYSMDIKISKNIWEFTPDGVMGGKSKGSIQFLNTEGFDYISFRGNVNTDGGGFLMFRSKIDKKDLYTLYSQLPSFDLKVGQLKRRRKKSKKTKKKKKNKK